MPRRACALLAMTHLRSAAEQLHCEEPIRATWQSGSPLTCNEAQREDTGTSSASLRSAPDADARPTAPRGEGIWNPHIPKVGRRCSARPGTQRCGIGRARGRTFRRIAAPTFLLRDAPKEAQKNPPRRKNGEGGKEVVRSVRAARGHGANRSREWVRSGD